MKRVPPPVLGLGAAAAQRALTRDAGRPSFGRKVAAGVILGVSGGLATSAERQFRRAGTTVDPFHPDRASALVTTGPNAITRNPMYVGLTGALVAHALLRGSWLALVPAAGFVVAIDRWQIASEEAALLERFGDEYDAYRAAVPRWIGSPRR